MKITVKKYDPSVDAAPRDVEYEVPYSEYMTVLEAIIYIHENCEPLAFDYSCKGRVCGRCAMVLDGEPILACVTALTDADHTLEPLGGFQVVRDLVVDKHPFHARMSSLQKRTRISPITEEEILEPIPYEVFEKGVSTEWCARCGVCMASCPVVNGPKAGSYAGPTAMVSIAKRFYDPYDEGDRVYQAVQEGLFNCIMCGKCDEVCAAKEIHHLEMYQELRDAAIERGLA